MKRRRSVCSPVVRAFYYSLEIWFSKNAHRIGSHPQNGRRLLSLKQWGRAMREEIRPKQE
jgi:hypothetical protein